MYVLRNRGWCKALELSKHTERPTIGIVVMKSLLMGYNRVPSYLMKQAGSIQAQLLLVVRLWTASYMVIQAYGGKLFASLF
jgi:hypothetical protein